MADKPVAENEKAVIESLAGEKKDLKVTPGWEKVLYTPQRVEQWIKGEITLAELSAISGPEMLEMAITGFRLYENGRFDDAKVIFKGLAALDPKESYYLTALGAVYLAQEDLDNAEICFTNAIKLNPKELASYVNRGEVFLRRGKVMEAAQDFKQAVDLDPKGEDPLSHRARVLAAAALEAIQDLKAGNKDKEKPAAPAAKAAPAKAAPAKAAAAPAAKAAGKKK